MRHIKIFLLLFLLTCTNNEQIVPNPPDVKVVFTGIRTASATDAQINFINNHFDYVMTSLLSQDVRKKITKPKLFLYRSIQSTWENFSQFDWAYIDKHENMFCHNNGKRIITVYSSYLMNGGDLVDSISGDALNHWINYYAFNASEQVYKYDYDGLFIDEASHKLSSGVVYGIMPTDEYPDSMDSKWRDDRYKALKFIKSYFLDKTVVFNGLHSDNGAEQSLSYTDGGMWETFAFNVSTGEYYGKKKWQEVIELAQRNRENKFICIVSKKEHLTEEIDTRMFILSSYLLVSNKNVVLYMSDLTLGTDAILYYPEYMVDLGKPLDNYTQEEGLYKRMFEKGLVLVNPDDEKSIAYSLSKEYNQVIPNKGGLVKEDGSWEGYLSYQKVIGKMPLSPMSGVILIIK